MAIVAPNGYVMKVYKSEANALSDSNALKVDDSNGAIKNSNPQDLGYGFWTHTKYWYRIEANEPVVEFYIDWDDGENNDPKGKANYTSIKLDSPSFVGITSHIYTGNSTTSGGYFPKIRAKSIEGYWSKYYQNSLGAFTHTGIDVLVGETSMSVGRNSTYKIESDQNSSTNERIPALYPEIKPPVGVLKSDKRRVYAGIDNGYLRGTNGTLSDVGASNIHLIEIPNNGSSVRTAVRVRVTYQNLGDDSNLHGRGHIETTDMTLAGTSTLSYVVKVLKVELLDLLEDSVPWNGTGPSASKLYPGEKMALVNVAYGNTTSAKKQSTIAEVSLGNPILNLEDPKHNVIYDLTESFARTPEQSITNYFIDDGKVKIGNGYASDDYFQASGHSSPANSDIFTDTNGVIETSSGTAKRSYVFDVGYNYVDSDGRWLPKQILARGQVKVSNPLGSTAISNQQYSPLEHWRHEGLTNNYSDVVTAAAYNYPSDMSSSGILAFKSSVNDDRWTDLEDRNRKVGEDDNHILTNGNTSTSVYDIGANNSGDIDHQNNNSILLCARDSKWTKQFWKGAQDPTSTKLSGKADLVIPGSTVANDITTGNGAYSQGIGTDGIGHMNTKVEIYYTGYESDKSNRLMWKPLLYKNYTKHPDYDNSTWYTDGAFEWEEPDDWVAVDPDDIPNEFYPRGIYFAVGDASSFAYSDDIYASGSYIPEVATVTVTGSNISSGSEVSSQAIYSGGADVTDGLSLIVAGDSEDIVGKYFLFTEQVSTGDVTYYPWFRQAATGTRHTFRVSNAGSATGTATDFTWQVGSGQQLYSKALIITLANGSTYGVWLNCGSVTVNGFTGAPLSPFGALGIVAVDNLIEVNTSTMTGTASTTIVTDIADLITTAINSRSELGATRSGNDVLVTWTNGQGGYTTGYDSTVALAPLSSSNSNEDSRSYFAHNADSASYDGKDASTTPEAHAGLGSYTPIPVDYTDGADDDDIAIALAAAINGHANIDSNTATVSNNVVTLTQQEAGAVADLAHGDSTATAGGDNLNLADGFTFATTTAGVDAVYGNDWFEDGAKWNATNKKYALMMLPKTNSGLSGTSSTFDHIQIQHTWPCSNSHSVLVDLIDPMHVSLNNHSIVQSITYTHKGKYQKVENRLGKSDIRKIGSSNGTLSFGGIDLNDDGRVKFQRYQNDGVPVYLDVENTNGDFTRFFGIITSMSRDHPTGKMIPKFGLQMDITHIITMNSTGSILSDGYISLGGAIDEPKYT